MPPTEERPTTPPRPGFLWVYKWDPTYGTHSWVEEQDPASAGHYPGWKPGFPDAPPKPGYHWESAGTRDGVSQGAAQVPDGKTRDFAAETAYQTEKWAWEGYTYNNNGTITHVPGTGGDTPFTSSPGYAAKYPNGDPFKFVYPDAPETVRKPPPNYGSWTDENGVIRANPGPGEAGRSQSQAASTAAPAFSFTPKYTAAAAPKMEQAYAGAVPLPKAQAAKPWIPDSWRARPGRDKVGGQAWPKFSWNPWQRKV